MDITFKILIIQICVFLCIHILIHSDSPLIDFIEKKFEDYEKFLYITYGSQLILIITTLCFFFN